MASGLLLTGGRSRRLGIDKASLVLDGETLAVRAARMLASVCDAVVEVGPGYTDQPHVVERPRGAGPLAAITAGAAALAQRGRHGPVLVLAVDLPRVDAPLLRLLHDWPGTDSAVPEVGGRLQPVCARYSGEALRAAASLVDAGVRALHALLDIIEYDTVPESAWRAVAPADAFDDVDTREDAQRLGLDLGGLA
jgi:molybdopterin-guanine dinucleotide biosynthesis protein A